MRNLMLIPRSAALVSVPALALCLLLVRSEPLLHAQNAAPAKTVKSVSCDAGTSQWLEAPRVGLLSKGVRFGQDDETLKTDTVIALFDKDHNIVSAKAQGPVHLFDQQNDLTGQHGSVDFTKHLATLTDSIILVVKPDKQEAGGKSLRKQFKDPATLTCEAMTYDYRFKIGRIPGPLTVTQVIQTKDDGPQTRVLTADAGLYNGKAETIQLVGDIKGTYSDGSVIQGDTRALGKPVLINIKEGAESIFVPFPTQAHFTVKPNSGDGKGDPKDDEPDLTLPTPPAHTPAPGSTAPAPSQTSPVPVQAPAPKQASAPGTVPNSSTSPPPAGAGTP